MKTLPKSWRDGLIAAAGALLFTAMHAAAIDTEDRIVNGQIVGATAAQLMATSIPTHCYCQENCTHESTKPGF